MSARLAHAKEQLTRDRTHLSQSMWKERQEIPAVQICNYMWGGGDSRVQKRRLLGKLSSSEDGMG